MGRAVERMGGIGDIGVEVWEVDVLIEGPGDSTVDTVSSMHIPRL